MWYVEILVADASYHGSETLTYQSAAKLRRGQVVLVPLRGKQVQGLVVALVKKPSFTAKDIISAPELPALPEPLCGLIEWMRGYYPAPLGILTQLFVPSRLPRATEETVAEELEASATLPALTKEQNHALRHIHGPGLHLLHGETGSGKTRVYIELARRSLANNQSCLVLTPEIGLTSQLASTFQEVFGSRVMVVHSGLSDANRLQTWRNILTAGVPVIVIGTRSGLFSPVKNLGVIIVDEAHETAYKQDQAPYYHASKVGAKLADLHQATLVLGSATPLVADYYVAAAKQRPIIRMKQRAIASDAEDAVLQVIDLRDRKQFSKSPYLSDPLIRAVERSLKNKEQALLFLNRRGTARVVFCERCGWQAACPHCDLPLIYHGDSHIVRCHSCSFKIPSPSSCPDCQNVSIIFRTIGTKAIAVEVERLFPEARVRRFDTDNTKAERLETHYQDIRAGGADIIVGTQTLAKGLDLPQLSLVGVVQADTSLYFPDFSATERTYQLLSQVLGRIGRGHRKGTAIIQTYTPNSPIMNAIMAKDWNTFYNKELAERQDFTFPPFCYLLKLTCKRASSASAQKAADQLAAQLRALNYSFTIEGPAPAFQEKQQNKYMWQLILKAKQRNHLTAVIHQLPSGWSYDIDPMNLL